MSVANSLNAEELRVLACLIEKSYTTPDQYPLSTNALTTACNQKTSREPVVDYSPQLVDGTLQLLRDAGWVRMIRASGSRAFKHKHVIEERLGLTAPQQAIIAVLALRGAQSPGELKTRTERYHPFEDLSDVERVLGDLVSLDTPLVQNVGRAAGQSQDRWIQLLGPAGDGRAPDPRTGDAGPGSTGSGPADHSATAPPAPPGGGERTTPPDADLVARVIAIEERLAALERELGIEASE